MRTQQGVRGLSRAHGQENRMNEPLSQRDVRQLVQTYGSQSSANFVFQSGVEYFGNLTDGVIAYAQHKGILGRTNIVFTNPLCSSSKMESLLRQFLTQRDEPTLFLGVDKTVAERLVTLGYKANQVGVESYIELNAFNTVGKHKKQLRHASNFSLRHPCKVSELPWAEVDSDQVLALSDAWRAGKGVSRRELKLLTRPPVFEDEPDVRKFYCFQGERLLGFVFFEPYYEAGEIKGYCANIIRSLPGTEHGCVSDYIILEAIKQFRTEGVNLLSLGLSPLYDIQPERNDLSHARFLFNQMYRHANSLYAFKGLAYHKTRYRPTQEPWYLCSKGISMPRLLGALFFGLGVL